MKLNQQRLLGAAILFVAAVIIIVILMQNSLQRDEQLGLSLPESPRMPNPKMLVPNQNQKDQQILLEIESDRRKLITEEAETQQIHQIGKPQTKLLGRQSHSESNMSDAQQQKQLITDQIESTTRVTSGWAIQAASFKNSKNAQDFLHALREKGYRCYTEEILNVDNITITRVYVGPELKKAKAKDLIDRLKTDFKIQGILIRYQP